MSELKFSMTVKELFPILLGKRKTLVQSLETKYIGQSIMFVKTAFEAEQFKVVLKKKGIGIGLPFFYPERVTLYYDHQNKFVNAHYF
jgi:hypothetical protein